MAQCTATVGPELESAHRSSWSRCAQQCLLIAQQLHALHSVFNFVFRATVCVLLATIRPHSQELFSIRTTCTRATSAPPLTTTSSTITCPQMPPSTSGSATCPHHQSTSPSSSHCLTLRTPTLAPRRSFCRYSNLILCFFKTGGKRARTPHLRSTRWTVG